MGHKASRVLRASTPGLNAYHSSSPSPSRARKPWSQKDEPGSARLCASRPAATTPGTPTPSCPPRGVVWSRRVHKHLRRETALLLPSALPDPRMRRCRLASLTSVHRAKPPLAMVVASCSRPSSSPVASSAKDSTMNRSLVRRDEADRFERVKFPPPKAQPATAKRVLRRRPRGSRRSVDSATTRPQPARARRSSLDTT